MLPHADGVEHDDSVGYAAPSVELGVDPIDPDDPLVGELVARGANVATWYWRRPEETVETVIDGWLYTDGVDVDQASVIDRVSRSLSDFKVPQYLIVVDEPLPRNPGGKLLKGKLRDKARWGPPLR